MNMNGVLKSSIPILAHAAVSGGNGSVLPAAR